VRKKRAVLVKKGTEFMQCKDDDNESNQEEEKRFLKCVTIR